MADHATWSGRRQALAYAAIGGLAVALTAGSLPAAEAQFRRLYGLLDPRLVSVLASAAGGVALWRLRRGDGFQIIRGVETVRGIGLSAVLATALAAAVILADCLIRYPRDLNVPIPIALLFYPPVGLVAEVVFHLLPLAILRATFAVPGSGSVGAGPARIAFVLTALVEPIFQVAVEEDPLSGRAVYTGLHVLAVSSLQLVVFRRYDFASMYAFRLIYYAYWHVAWGALRLVLLF